MEVSARYKFSTYEVRVQRCNESPGSLKVDTPIEALNYWREKIATCRSHDPEREACVSIMLNTRMVALSHALVSVGTLNESIVHPRDVFRAAIAMNAWGVVVMHNHPSGDPTPSEADRRITQRLVEASNILQIRLVDHVIVGADERPHFSFREAGVV
jgi:DNA repair protein RadC